MRFEVIVGHGLEQGLQTCLSEGHISCYTVRRPDISRNVIVLGYVTFCQINKCFVKVSFFIIDKIYLRAVWGPQVAVWRLLD